jgi:hypothetical protein
MGSGDHRSASTKNNWLLFCPQCIESRLCMLPIAALLIPKLPISMSGCGWTITDPDLRPAFSARLNCLQRDIAPAKNNAASHNLQTSKLPSILLRRALVPMSGRGLFPIVAMLNRTVPRQRDLTELVYPVCVPSTGVSDSSSRSCETGWIGPSRCVSQGVTAGQLGCQGPGPTPRELPVVLSHFQVRKLSEVVFSVTSALSLCRARLPAQKHSQHHTSMPPR